MSRQINQPINQVRLTNVAVVRMSKGGKRFEIACYRNKVVDYRQGLEQDLSEVLQTDRVFTNVSKGEFAKAKDLQKVFGTKDEEEIAKIILTKGQLQVSDKERTQQLEKTSAQIAEWVSKNCVHPESDRPYTISQIRHAMQQANFSVHPTKPLKRQYLDCVKLLQNIIPIQRAKMELLLLVPSPGDVKEEIETILNEHEVPFTTASEEKEEENPKESTAAATSTSHMVLKYQIFVDPSLYRILNDAIQKIGGDAARIEILNQVVTKQGDVNLEAELGTMSVNQGGDDAYDVNQTVQLLKQSHLDDEDDDDGDEYCDQDDEELDGESDNGETTMISRRKSQQKAKKKNQKAKRRTVDVETNASSTSSRPPVNTNEVQVGTTTTIMNKGANNPSSSNIDDSNDSSGRKSCNTCGGFFDTAADFRAHFKSDWHRFNQKLKMKGAAPISEKEFLLCDSDTFFAGKGDDIFV
jgi:ribosome maturation protein SDO1